MEQYAHFEDMPLGSRNTAERINQERRAAPRAYKSFADLFADELHGCLDVMFPHIENSFSAMTPAVGSIPQTRR